MPHRALLPAAFLAAALCVQPSRADFIFYRVPGTPLELVFQGTVTVNPGGTITYKHPKFPAIYFGRGDVEIQRAETTEQQGRKMLSKALNTKDADKVFQAGLWLLKHGMLEDFYEAVDKTLELDPQHARAINVIELKKLMEAPLTKSGNEEAELRALVPNKNMKVKTSAHYILLHDTPDKPPEGHKVPRADVRLALLEQVYQSFLLLFYAQGVDLEIPQERLKVVLFNDYNDYLNYSTKISPALKSASGYWHSKLNIAVFYDHGSDEEFKILQKFAADLRKDADEALRLKAINTRDIVRTANAMNIVVQAAQENEDIEVVSHECTHQMAGNTGLFPRQVQVPSWIHEGLATYFESPGDASWSGIGAVNKTRINWYRALEEDREHSNIDFIVGDQIFDLAATHGSKLHAYGQAWALTHFLVENHFEKLMNYYRSIGELPRDLALNPEILAHLFKRSFPDDPDALDNEWRSYMRSLKTDIEKALEDR